MGSLLIYKTQSAPTAHHASSSGGSGTGERLSFGLTRATLLRQKVPAPPPAPLWTMPRFRDAAPATQSFRCEMTTRR